MSARSLFERLEEQFEGQAQPPQEDLLQALLDSLFDGVIIIDQNGQVRAVNAAVETIFGCKASELIGRDASSLMPLEKIRRTGEAVPGHAEGVARGDELTGRRSNGAAFPMIVNLSQTTIDGEPIKVAVVRDLTEHRRAEQTIRELALNDALTGLANRDLFHRRLEEAFRGAAERGCLVALMLLNLDGFKGVNDSYGHSIGDALLKHVARRLKKVTRKGDTVARLGSDEFAVVMVGLETPDAIRGLAARILADLSKPVTLEGSLLRTGASIGIGFYPRDDTDPDELIRKADIALDAAKGTGRGTYRLYDEIMDAPARAAKVLEADLRLAVVRNEFELFYQPKLCIDGRRVTGAEALVRWRHPTRGTVPPGDFIPIAESSDLMVHLGEWVLRAACEQAKAWQDSGFLSLPVAVNISARQFRDSDFVATLKRILRETGLDPRLLELEITEGMMMEDTEQVIDEFYRIHDLGVEISIDDFGTGYSSLAYLKRLPVHRLKIDRSFVRDLTTEPDDAAITEAVIKMGHSLNLKVIAEGVEMEEQVTYLRSKGCDELQGFLFSQPLPAQDFERWFTSWQQPLAV
jgi:diguanylate cyclase (GGDEF)-like protein/PAS domain S-box-containing protein